VRDVAVCWDADIVPQPFECVITVGVMSLSRHSGDPLDAVARAEEGTLPFTAAQNHCRAFWGLHSADEQSEYVGFDRDLRRWYPGEATLGPTSR
jgi:hypothetical protein